MRRRTIQSWAAQMRRDHNLGLMPKWWFDKNVFAVRRRERHDALLRGYPLVADITLANARKIAAHFARQRLEWFEAK